MTTADYLAQLLEQNTVEAVWSTHCAEMARLGFDRLLYVHGKLVEAEVFHNPRDALVLSNHDPDYLDKILSDEVFGHLPMVTWAASRNGACAWTYAESPTDQGAADPRTRQIGAINREFGVFCGYSISFKQLSQGDLAVISLTAAPGRSQEDLAKTWADHGQEILLKNRVMHLAVVNLPSAQENRLTQRQREVLELVAKGRTIPQICALIGRRPATVEKHLRLAREAMDAQSTAQAVLKAAVQKQIFVRSGINGIDFTDR